MNVKLRVLSAGAMFFLGQFVFAQENKADTAQVKNIDEVVVQGYRTVTKKTAIGSTQTIKAETIENRAQANVMNAVQGQLAGVNISTGSGQPGSKPTVIIRGRGSLSANSDPLYVIDGFPSNSDSFRSLNSYDIESMEVLKDPAVLSEYGNRGSNGVIVIKTKRGAFGGGRLSVRYNTQTGISSLQSNKYNISNTRDILTLENRAGTGLGFGLTQSEIDSYPVDTDWVNYFFRPSFLTSHNISVENSGKNFSSYTSAGYLQQDGILEGTDLNRFSFRNNLSGRSENQRFQYHFGLAAGISRNTDQPNVGTSGVNQNPVLGAYSSVPYMSPEMYSNSINLFNDYADDGTLKFMPLFLIDKIRNSYNKFTETRLDANAEVSYKVVDGLTARLRTNAQSVSQKSLNIQRPDSFNMILFSTTPNVPYANGGAFNGTETMLNNQTFLFTNLVQLDYKKAFGQHTFSINANTEYNFSEFNANSQTQRGLNPKTYVPGTGAGYVADTAANDWYVPTILTQRQRLNMVSYFGSLDYDFARKYGVSGTVRRDGTSRFLGDRQWGTFWSVGGRWNIDEENFMDNVSFVDMLKLRGSYGTVGNQRIVDGTIFAGLNPPGFYDVYTAANNIYNSGQGYNIAFGDPQLRWETTKSYNFGLDFELFSRRLRGSFDLYERKTVDMYFNDPTSPSLGALEITRNTDIVLYNRGYELNLAYDLIKNSSTTLTFRANAAINNQEVDGIQRNNGIIASGTTLIQHNANGMLPYIPYLFHYIGVNPANGNLLFEDANGNPTETPVEADRKYAKYNYLPKYQGGFGFDFDYKGFFASTTFTFVAGIQRFDSDLDGFYDPSSIGQLNVSSDLLDSWTPENPNASLPSLNAANKNFDASSDRFLVDASYLRLRNAQLGYRIPKDFLRNTFINDASIMIQAENLFTWTKWRGFDPESNRAQDSNQYPTAKAFTLGFDIKF